MRADLPAGTVTFLFTDVEGSTKLLHELGAEGYAEALAEHRRVIREACAAQGGVEVDTQGDAFFFAFPTAPGALTAADAVTEALVSGPIQVRIGLHTGAPLLTDEGYVGDDVHFAARMAATGHGGQVVLSEATAELVELELRSLGSHRLKDIADPVSIYQLGDRSYPPLKTIANSNLPTPASSFLGREDELYEADELLQQTRLLTVTGPGGQGKTRFALELARRAREERFSDYRDGVFSCFFSSLRDATLVLATIANTLSVREQPGKSALETLSSHLEGKSMLLLLDNLEHLLESAPELSELLSRCPGLTLLVTSRELLRVQGERAYDLAPLAESEGVFLFCDRAQTEPSEDIRALCARLEGLPLAIELAAARTSVLSPVQILGRLAQRLDLLKGGRDADPRQQTLRATIAWSYELLSAEEQRLFVRLSVFSGGCTLEAADEVAEADVDTLQSLVDKSLLRFTEGRYWMLETIREYALERLEEEGEAEAMGLAHSGWMLRLAQHAEKGLEGADQTRWMNALQLEEDNLRAALAWMDDAGRSREQLQLIGRIAMYWYVHGNWLEGRRWADAAIERSDGRTIDRAKSLYAAGSFAAELGDYERAKECDNEALAIFRELGDARGIAQVLTGLGNDASGVRDYASAVPLYEEAMSWARQAGDRSQLALATGNLATALGEKGDYARAIDLAEAALAIYRDLRRDHEIGWMLYTLAHVLFRAGRSEDAVPFAREGLALARAASLVLVLRFSFVLFGALAAKQGDPERGARCLGVAGALREEFHMAPDELDSETERDLRRTLGDERYEAAFDKGRELPMDEAVAYALEAPDA
jgi:predicted ATPase